jgi:hypothetical protein
LGLFFSERNYTRVELSFPATPLASLTVTVLNFPIGTNTVTAKIAGSGTAVGVYTRASDSLSITADFVLDHSLITLGSSTFLMTLTTGTVFTSLPPGSLTGMPISRVAQTLGRVALVGSSVLSGAFAGTAVTASIRGTLSQFPP